MRQGNLNVVYIGGDAFPVGFATTKRRRYMVDYMNSHDIQSRYLVCGYKKHHNIKNPTHGWYGSCEYRDITSLATSKNYIAFWRQGKKQLREWFAKDMRNVLIFSTTISVFEYPFYLYARKLGYKIVFDHVETCYWKYERTRFIRKMYLNLSEWLSNKAYRHSAAFVISKNLWNEVLESNPNRKVCLLPNSTPQLCQRAKKTFSSPIKILYSGTFASKDGVKYLLDGVMEAREAGANIELTLLGKGVKADMAILDSVKDKAYIRYLGFVPDEELIEHLLESDILCMTRCNSVFANYGFPFKLSEYLSTGNVVLATSVGDVDDYVRDRESAYIIPPEDSHAIANAILHIEANPEEALNVAQGGLEAMRQHFSIEKVGETFVSFLSGL